MLGFYDKFKITLDISESRFIDNLLLFIESHKEYSINIKFNHFDISHRTNSFKKPVGKIIGSFTINNDKLEVEGQIINYKLVLILVTVHTTVFLGAFTHSLFINLTNDFDLLMFGALSIIGVINYFVAIRKLNAFKDDFIETVKMFDKQEKASA